MPGFPFISVVNPARSPLLGFSQEGMCKTGLPVKAAEGVDRLGTISSSYHHVYKQMK